MEVSGMDVGFYSSYWSSGFSGPSSHDFTIQMWPLRTEVSIMCHIRGSSWVTFFMVYTGWLCIFTHAQMKIPPETVQKWAITLSEQINAIASKYSGAALLQKKLKDVEPIIRIEDVDGARLVQDFADEIERMLGSKMKSVKRLADTAEDADLYHEYNASLQFDYFNALLVNTMDEEGNFIELGGEFPLEENEHFNKLSVNTLMSDILVPTNVYNKDPDILNGVYMSETLNDIFINNFQKDPTLTWQYFGSSAGFFRLYPGIKWTPDANGVVSFDCRNRNWYIQAATSPKDIVIVVDVSGSMKGLKMTIAKHTINTILDTLGENDFVNVIAYTDYVRYVEPCFKGTLVQADLDNREHFKLLVEELHVKGEAKVKKAMKESFRILADARANGQGSLCNQAIMLITDGAMEDFQSVFEEFNWPDKKVRVFTYLIGRDMTFSENVKWIACNNKGYYTHISTLADVQENVMEYLHVLSRPMVINHDHDIIWTEAYMDSVLFKSKAHSLLLMTSVAMPVFSKKKETLSHGILLGVVGTDVPLLEVMKLAPRYKLGAHGYAFLITNNGYILAHPDLRPLYSDGKKLKPKPNYNSVDLSEAEWEDTKDSLRTAMVKGETGTLNLDVRAAVDKGKRPVFLKNDYFYTTINETPFSFGMVLTRGHGQYVFFGNVSVEEGLHDLQQPDLTIADEWTYCETDIDPHHRKLTQLQAVVRYLTGKEPDLECDEILLQEVLFDAVVTAPLEAYWTALTLTAPGVDEGMESAFLGTRSGLMRVIRYAGSEKRVGKKFLTPVDKENLFTVDHFPIWYRLAAENKPGQFFFYVPHDDINKGKNTFVAVTSVTVTEGKRTAVAGAIGMQASMDLLERVFMSIAKQPNNTDCSDVDGICPLSCESIDVNCYLVDNNGFIMVSKEKGDVGKFFGEIDGSVMAQLLKSGLFKRVTLYDYQAMCKNAHHHASGARPLLSPFYGLLAIIKWFFSHFVMLLLEFNICGLWHNDYVVDAKAGFHATHRQKKVELMQPCNTEYPGFMYDTSIRETNSIIKCGRCQKMFVLQQVPNSNLVMLVVQADCDCSRQYAPITLAPREVKYNATVKCNSMKSQKIRRRPESCHAYHPHENAKDCGGACGIAVSLTLYFICLATSLALR
ncbi:voltage-dependent calcium channel subunit alpha-2/delta-4-like isoform X2 [Sinocyclocheilus anshuiensis]|uniref:voltage-dependent calcium channel subunit alpha-2/delta-4-like isoform X2 n=1 Tax=Sinocyclocheilus anshuiensis TaxID=1608454 RepID=UPI0007B81B22|nr:PREDICTED: voltage-dependent calcium channel subunit alpha-2/delta-4-like isoform X2 [Sinocyclocheilus anshuiensis]